MLLVVRFVLAEQMRRRPLKASTNVSSQTVYLLANA